MKIFVINLPARTDRIKFMEQQLEGLTWERFNAIDGHSLGLSEFEAMGFKPYKEWKDPLLGRNLTLTEIATSISHYLLWEKCAAINEPILILEDDSELVSVLDPDELNALANLYDIIYLDHKEMFPDQVKDLGDLTIPYYPYWNNAYVMTPDLAKAIIDSKFKENLIPVDEYLPLIEGVDYTKHCLGNYQQFSKLKDIFKGVECTPVAFKQHVFRQKSRSEFGSDIESGRLIMNINVNVITVATDENKLNYLNTSCNKFGIRFTNLGSGVEWSGGDMTGPGGGQKINLVLDYVKTLPADTIVLFMDGYDVFVNDDLHTIVERFLGFKSDILFAAEKVCWPDRTIAPFFNESETDYKYLNSGLYMGYASSVLSFIEDYIPNGEDDQLFLQKKYIINKLDRKINVKLDTENYIFQCLSSSKDDVFVKPNNQLTNVNTRCCPCIVHGNGGPADKEAFNNLYKRLFSNETPDYPFIMSKEFSIVGPEILEMDFMTPEMCAKLINKAETVGKWESMYGDKFPAQELRIREFDMDFFNTLEAHFKNFINPAIESHWWPLQMYGLRDAFIIKYSTNSQKSLNCHHDASLVSGIVKLNSDYSGGDTYFYRQNYSNINTPVGKIVLWPGQVTHGHEGREVTAGTKYNLVIWTSRRQGDVNY